MLNRLIYRGPAMATLHEQYAKQGRIDDQAFVSASATIDIAAPVERVWAMLSDVPNWHAVDATIHDVNMHGGVAVDTPFTWSKGKAGITSRFAVVDPHRELTWTGLSFGAKAVHRHLLEATDLGTRLHSEESMAGPLVVLFYSREKLEADLQQWLEAVKTAAEAL